MPTVVDLLRRRATAQPDACAYRFVQDDTADAAGISYTQLDQAARRVAAMLTGQAAAGQPVLLLLPPGLDYVVGFLGCLYAGAIAVPAYPPEAGQWHRTLPRLRGLVTDSGARVALCDSGLASAGSRLASESPELAELAWLPIDSLPDATGWRPPPTDPDQPALLQYTSGSTGDPRGVVISHANLWHNAGLVSEGFLTTPESVGVSWLPPYHDMGLIGGILQPLYGGFPVVLMSPLTFLRRPLFWLETMARYGATVSGGPNFAFDLCVRKSTPEQRAGLDLSGWRVAFCGAEPVRSQTLARFAEAFAPAGFTMESFYPCYGLAEATLIVTGGQPPRPAAHGRVGSGRPLGGQRLVVVDPATGEPAPAGAEGEIWLAGPSVAQGYWGRPAATAETFRARLAGDPHRRYLRTGDLGLLDPTGELVVTGRAKDLIIVRGRNLSPPDLEAEVEARVAGVRPGTAAAFPVVRDGREQAALVCELAPGGSAATVIPAIRRAVTEAAQVAPAVVVLLRPGRVPKTSSGKIQRYACRQAVAEGVWAPGAAGVVEFWDAATTDEAVAGGDPVGEEVTAGVGATVHSPVVALAAEVLAHPAGSFPTDQPLTQLGLDSVGAIELQGLLDYRLGVTVSLTDLLTGATLDDLARRPARAAPPGAPVPTPAGGAAPAGDGATDGQRALWLLQQWDPQSTAYQINRAARIRSPLDVAALERALRAVIDRHPALRTRLPSPAGEPIPQVSEWSGPVLTHHDATGWSEPGLRQQVQVAADRPFDLAAGPLLRVDLYTRAADDHILLLSLHHTITDFWSLSVLVGDVLAAYRAEPPDRRSPATGPATGPATVEDRHLAYWRETLAGAPAALDLPTTYPRPRRQSFRGDSHQFRVPAPAWRRLTGFARAVGASPFAVVAAGFAAVLARYTGEPEVVVGAPTAGRGHAQRDQLGYFVNPVPLRIPVPPRATFGELVDTVRRRVIEALEHAVPFPRLVAAVQPVRDPARPAIMQVMLVLQQAPAGRPDLGAFAVGDETAHVTLAGLDLQPYRLRERGAAFDATLTLAEVNGGLTGEFCYAADLFDQPAIARLADHLTRLLTAGVADPDAPVASVELLDGPERAAVLAHSAGPVQPYPDRTTLHAWFAAQAAAHPAATAVVAGTVSLSYAELDQRTDRLAGLLTDRYGVGRGDLVGVHLPRGADAVVAFWAALKSGGGYAPLAPDLPPARLRWLLADARPSVVLSHRSLAEQLPDEGPPRLCLDEPWPAGPDRPTDLAGPADLAYVLYTSGSTGRPKPVALTHQSAGNLAESLRTGLATTADSRVLQFASCAYDVHVADILQAHLSGACLYVPPAAATVPGPALVDFLTAHRITHAILSPSVLSALPDAPLPDLRHLLCGGEALTAEVVARWGTGRQFRNAYGPTETTVCVTWVDCDPADRRRPRIGAPMPNVRAYVLDAALRPVPVGVPGELCIGGVAVGLGYLGRPELTARQFVPDPFDPAGGRLYRTGDRVRWLPDGTLDFLGRFDDQVKIRGVRVEPGEVAARLRELLGIDEVAVVARPARAGGAELVAYLAGTKPLPPVSQLRGMLRADLPAPWLPAAFVQLPALPLNRSGKLDRRALPAPTAADRGRSTPLAARTDLERLVAQVWAQVLDQPAVGVRDHFFDELGGTSLQVARVTTALTDQLGQEVPVTWLFEHPTVESLARRLAGPPAPDAAAAAGSPTPEEQAARRRRALARRNPKDRP